MKRIYIIVIGLIFAIPSINAQQFPLSNQYLINSFSLSPAYAGMDGSIEGFMGFRRDWTNISMAPETKSLYLHGALSDKIGVGASVISDKTDIFTNLYVSLAYSYHLKFDEQHSLSLNVNAGLTEKNIDLSNAVIQDVNDPVLFNANTQNGISFYTGAALLYRLKGLNIGVYSPLIWESNTDFGENEDLNYNLNRYYIGHASYNFMLGENWNFKPIAIVRQTEETPLNYEGGAMLGFKNQLWLTGMYRKNSVIGIGLGGAISERLVFNYVYEFSNSGILSESAGTHEFSVGIKLGKSGKSEEDEIIKQLRANESKLKSQVDSLERSTSRMESELADLKNKVEQQEISGTPVDNETKQKIRELENRINQMKEEINSNITQVQDYDNEYMEGRVFYVVVGAFAYKNNAEKYADECRQKGYKPNFYLNKNKNMNYVYLYKSTKWQDATNKKMEFREAGFTNAWLYYE